MTSLTQGTRTGSRRTSGTLPVSLHRLREIDVEKVRERGEPGEGVGELVLEVRSVSGPDRSREFPDLLGEPTEGGVDAPPRIPLPIDRGHRLLQFGEFHGGPVYERCGTGRSSGLVIKS